METKEKVNLDLLKVTISELSDISKEDLSEDASKLNKAKVGLNSILEKVFCINNNDTNILDKISLKYFENLKKEEKLLLADGSTEELFQLFLKAKRIKRRLDSVVLSDSEVNKQIQAKFCKVTSPYGEGTGYIIDEEKGIILSNFHLVNCFNG